MEVESAAIEESVLLSHSTNGAVNGGDPVVKEIAALNGDSITIDQDGNGSVPDNEGDSIEDEVVESCCLSSQDNNGSGWVPVSHESNGSGRISTDVVPVVDPSPSPSPPPPPPPAAAAAEQPWPTSGWTSEGHGSGWISVDGAPVVLPAAPEQPWPTSKRHTFYLVRIPRSVDEKLRDEIRSAEAKLDQIIKKQDDNRMAMQGKKSQKGELLDKLKSVREREKGFLAALQDKRTKMEPFSTALNKFRGAQSNVRGKGQDVCSSEEELNGRIGEIEYRIQHESISLTEEKQLLREIKRLESTRSQVCANSILQQELVESLGPREEIQDQFKFLSQDMDSMRKELNSAFAQREPIEKELDKLSEEIEELRQVYDNLNAARQDAFLALRELKRKENSKNDGFFENKRDIQTAKELSAQKKREEVENFCSNNIEAFMKMWIDDDKFRIDYIKSNERSTVRRLETLDGRSLALGEKPPQMIEAGNILPSVGNGKRSTEPSAATVQPKASKTAVSVVSMPTVNHAVAKDDKQLKAPSSIIEGKIEKSSESLGIHKKILKGDDNGEERHDSEKRDDNVEEQHDYEARALELKEKLRQEQITKAKEAEERKKKRAEKSEIKAMSRAKKEAERKEKEREKKAQKKAAATASNVVGDTNAVALQGEDHGSVTEKAASSDVENSSTKEAADAENTSNRGQLKMSGVNRRKISSRELKGPRPPLPSRLSKKSAFPFPIWALVAAAVFLLLFIVFLFLKL